MGRQNRSEDETALSRRSFLTAGGEIMTGAWLLAQWPSIAAAAQHVETAAATAARFEFFSAGDALDVAAVCEQIVPGGATAGAREAHAVYFIDRSLATYFSALAPEFRGGLADFQAKYRAAYPEGSAFCSAAGESQIAYLKAVEQTPFFETMRMLTVVGMLASPKYGGNYQASGWKMMGFADQHAFAPPFGHYDREYAGFVPYPAKGRSSRS